MAKGYPDFEGQKTKLLTVADWAAVEAVDKSFRGVEPAAPFSEGGSVTYHVPSGKMLYITQVSFLSHAVDAANGDLPQIVDADIYDNTNDVFLWGQGGNGGGSGVLTKPIVVAAGTSVNFEVYNHANHICYIEIHASGYEL